MAKIMIFNAMLITFPSLVAVAVGQTISAGIRVQEGFTNPLTAMPAPIVNYTVTRRRFSVGPTVEVQVPKGFAINQYFPLPVGTLFVYEGTKEGVPTHDEICVTRQTRMIEGVLATVVHHRSSRAIQTTRSRFTLE